MFVSMIFSIIIIKEVVLCSSSPLERLATTHRRSPARLLLPKPVLYASAPPTSGAGKLLPAKRASSSAAAQAGLASRGRRAFSQAGRLVAAPPLWPGGLTYRASTIPATAGHAPD